MTPTKPDRRYRQDGIHTMDDLIGRCRRDDFTGCVVWAGPVHKGSGAVWLPSVQGRVAVTTAFRLLKGKPLNPGEVWYATCGNVLCVEHRAIGTKGDAMRAVRPTLDPMHRARIASSMRKSGGKYSRALADDIRTSDDTPAEIAARTGLDTRTISKVRLGQMWADSSSSVFAWRPA